MIQRLLVSHEGARLLEISPGRFRALVRERRNPVAAETEGGVRLFRRTAVECFARRRAEVRR